MARLYEMGRRAGAALVLGWLALVPGPAQAVDVCDGAVRGGVPQVRLAALARGFNLVGWMDRVERRRPPRGALETLRLRGFTHVRLPVDGALLMPAHAREGAIADRLLELDAAIGHLLALGYAVSLDMHPSEVFQARHRERPDAAFDDLRALWTLLARRYARSPADRVFFELLNEPAAGIAVWREQLERLIAVLRPIVPQHTFIVGTADFQQAHRLLESAPPGDANVVHAVHVYEPMSFTHQGAFWMAGDPVASLAGVPFPLSARDPAVMAAIARLAASGHAGSAALLARDAGAGWSDARIVDTMERLAAWGRRHDRAVMVNEFGVLKLKAPAGDRVRWLADVRAAAEARCLGWAVWEFDESFGFLTREGDGYRLDGAVLDALVPAR